MASSDNLIPDNLENLSKEELLCILESIKEINAQKKPIITKKKDAQSFDFRKYKKRHVALKFLYLGWDYSGFAVQVHTDKTIEEQLFSALQRTKLLECREASNYHRCGRTDKGVSAFCQVISLDLRSNLLEGKGIVTPENFTPDPKKITDKEIDYPSILNRVLPPEIRVIGWAPVETNFSARFDCIQRTYKYWFPVGNLNIIKMLEAGKRLVGEHDFRNFCKMDVANGVVNYKRKIFSVDIKSLCGNEGAYGLAELTVIGQAFLYHQIRCIISVLFLIGQGKEECQVVDELLDISKYPRKPQYSIASEIPLVLFDCEYEDVEWMYDKESIKIIIKHLQKIWTEHSVKATVTKKMLEELEKMCDEEDRVLNQVECLIPGVKSRIYKRLLDRPCCESLEAKIEHYSKKRKHSSKTCS